MRRLRKFQGFTLIELILVASIIGLLTAIALPKFSNLIEKAREARMKGVLGAVRSALAIYYVDQDGLFPNPATNFNKDFWNALIPKYLYLGAGNSRPAFFAWDPPEPIFFTRFHKPNPIQPTVVASFSSGTPAPNPNAWVGQEGYWGIYAWASVFGAQPSYMEFYFRCTHPDANGKVWSMN